VTEALYSVATMGLFPNVSGYALDVRDHSASCGAICRQLASDLDPEHIEGAFLCGLMHDIGKLLLIASKELIYFNAESSVLSLPESSIPLERLELGYDHGVLTGQVLWKWNIPSPVPQVVALHHLPVSSFKDSEFAKLISIVRVASVIDRQLMYSFTGLSDLISRIVNSDDGKLINLDENYLEEHWTKFLELRTEALMVFK
jgi:HD-like signal output (HDOD) protein